METKLTYRIVTFLMVLLCAFFAPQNIVAQVTLNQSNLPIVIITTENTPINAGYSVVTTFKIIYRGDGQTTYFTDQNNPLYQEYSGKAALKIRGNSSADFPKKQYSVEFQDALGANNPKAVLGMPKEHDWVLQAPYHDRSMMRNVVGYQLSNEMGRYAAKTKFCEVVLDGDYKGVYVFMERIKIDDDRVDVEKLDPLTDNSLPDITGGYIFRVDKGETDYSDGFITVNNGRYRFYDPEVADLSTQQATYLEDEVTSFENLMKGTNLGNPLTGYASKIDVATFVDQILLQEITDNIDAYRSSTYYHKYRNGKIRMGPVWDLNFAFGSYNDYGGESPTNWRMNELPTITAPAFNRKLFADPTFRCLMNQRWAELRANGMPLDLNNVYAVIDSVYNLLNQGAQQRNFTRWPDLLGQQFNFFEASGWQNRTTYLSEVDYLKQWITDRLYWMDNNMVTGTCPTAVPNGLVINEIMYNPKVTATQDEGDFEFIELYNNGTQTISLASIQFSLGINYTFATGTLAPGQYLVLAGNAAQFQSRYGFAPFGEYAGGLSNGGEKIVLADAFGLVLDEVEYDSALPWNVLADGTGASLELINPNADNQDPSNWFANLTPNGSPKAQNVPQTISCSPAAPQIVITEINYNSLSTLNAGDWVELKNISGATVNLSGWTFRDEGGVYTFPNNTQIANNGYLVLAEDIVQFAQQHLNITNLHSVSSGLGFGNGGEQLSLYDARGCLVDVVSYDDAAPWPTSPDGGGKTLELINTSLDNNLATSWAASTVNGGTPGTSSGGLSSGGLEVRVNLEGFYSTTTALMTDKLNTSNLISQTQPFSDAPYYHTGSEQTTSFPANTVDWVLLEVRSSANSATILERKAFLLRRDGYLMTLSGSTKLNLSTTGTHYIAVYHKSHLGVLSASTVNLATGVYDFTTAITKASGTQQQKMTGIKASMYCGDYDGSGVISNLDYNLWGTQSSAVNVYFTHDGDGNGFINNLDYNLWSTNKSKVAVLVIQK